MLISDLIMECMPRLQETLRSRAQDITMQGWLYKGPDIASESGAINFSKVIYCILKI